MEKKSHYASLGALAVVGVLLAFGLVAQPVRAPVGQGEPMTFAWLVAVGVLCTLPVPDPCPAVATAPNGDTVDLTGLGTFSIHPKSVTGGGTFTHNFAGGGSISGTWTATKMLGFNFYGEDDGIAGGQLVLAVSIDPGAPGGPTLKGTIWITCLVGEFPPNNEEGVRLSVPGGVNFNKEVSGLTVFVPI